MYKDAKQKPKAASKPSERHHPFKDQSVMGEQDVRNDPVGKQIYASNAYATQRYGDAINWYDRS